MIADARDRRFACAVVAVSGAVSGLPPTLPRLAALSSAACAPAEVGSPPWLRWSAAAGHGSSCNKPISAVTPRNYSEAMERLAVQDHQVLVLAAGDTPAARNNAKGHLFESFVALLLHEYGYEAPTTSDLNVHSDGIEIDVSAANTITRHKAIVECKAYTSNVRAQACTSFLGKLQLVS
ncbi:restriction endonuclease [Streptomyces sp. DT24]|uniref:restriction endonuclease n=1 Tax=Streptomyces sp. DT24 TaxID=3416520 RepID=UPI003CEFAB75